MRDSSRTKARRLAIGISASSSASRSRKAMRLRDSATLATEAAPDAARARIDFLTSAAADRGLVSRISISRVLPASLAARSCETTRSDSAEPYRVLQEFAQRR